MLKPLFRTVLAISLGAIAGSISRYYFGLIISHFLGTDFPHGTFIVNITGCLMMGFLTSLFLASEMEIHPDIRLFLFTGFLGSYTTFSSYALEATQLFNKQPLGLDIIYWGGSTFLGLLSLELGLILGKSILRLRKL